MARLLPGKPVAESVLSEVADRAAKLREHGVTPSLATILVGDDDASAGYIRVKQRQAAELGLRVAPRAPAVFAPRRPTSRPSSSASATTRPCTGCWCSTRSPATSTTTPRSLAMDPDKDVDGMHPINVGRLVARAARPVPCTPAGIEALLAFYEIPVAGHEVVILGRGATLGRPLAMLLPQKRPHRQRRRDRRTHGRAGLAALHPRALTSSSPPPACRASSSPSTCIPAPPSSAAGALRRPKAAARRRRELRRGGRRDHPAGRRGRADDGRHALPQRRRGRRARSTPRSGSYDGLPLDAGEASPGCVLRYIPVIKPVIDTHRHDVVDLAAQSG